MLLRVLLRDLLGVAAGAADGAASTAETAEVPPDATASAAVFGEEPKTVNLN